MLSAIQGRFDRQATALEDVRIDHGGFDVLVAEQLLHCTNIVPVLEQVGGEGVAEGVGADRLGNGGFPRGPLHGSL